MQYIRQNVWFDFRAVVDGRVGAGGVLKSSLLTKEHD